MASLTLGGLSFGVELDFVFCYKTDTRGLCREDEDVRDGGAIDWEEEKRLPPPAVFPSAPPRYGVWDWAAEQVKAAILSVPGTQLRVPLYEGSLVTGPKSYLSRDLYLFPDDGWAVTKSPSVVHDGVRLPRGHGCEAFEVISPAFRDTPASLRQVYMVVGELSRRFRTRVNLSTGFHCHVGNGARVHVDRDESRLAGKEGKLIQTTGPDFFALFRPRQHRLRVVKRAAALLWAADGFLCHVHPPERAINWSSSPIRFFSKLALGHGLDNTGDEKLDGPPGWPGFTPIPDHFLYSQTEGRQYPGQFFPALRPDKLDDEAMRRARARWGTFINAPDPRRVVNKTVFSGVRHIMRCSSREEVADLLRPVDLLYCTDRLNYSLDSYAPALFSGEQPALRGTAEFREAGGTLSAGWVVVWTSICLGILRFARDAPDVHFWTVVGKLAQAEAAAMRGEEHSYDMISLLVDMMLPDEARFLEGKLRGDPLGFWYPNRVAVADAEDEDSSAQSAAAAAAAAASTRQKSVWDLDYESEEEEEEEGPQKKAGFLL